MSPSKSLSDCSDRPEEILAFVRRTSSVGAGVLDFYPLLYMLTRVCKAKDWESGVELSSHLLGHLQTLQVHHIFPKKVLYKHEYDRPQVKAIANFTFLTQSANLWV